MANLFCLILSNKNICKLFSCSKCTSSIFVSGMPKSDILVLAKSLRRTGSSSLLCRPMHNFIYIILLPVSNINEHKLKK